MSSFFAIPRGNYGRDFCFLHWTPFNYEDIKMAYQSLKNSLSIWRTPGFSITKKAFRRIWSLQGNFCWTNQIVILIYFWLFIHRKDIVNGMNNSLLYQNLKLKLTIKNFPRCGRSKPLSGLLLIIFVRSFHLQHIFNCWIRVEIIGNNLNWGSPVVFNLAFVFGLSLPQTDVCPVSVFLLYRGTWTFIFCFCIILQSLHRPDKKGWLQIRLF